MTFDRGFFNFKEVGVVLRKRNKKVYGVGINDADYNVAVHQIVNGKDKIVWKCHFYTIWKSMLMRCYSEKFQLKRPTYRGCKVCDEWLVFSNFKKWMETQDWQGKHLDKDLLKEGNKVYCPEYCIFVDNKVNTFVIDSGASRGEYMLGVYWDKRNNKYHSQCSNPSTGKSEYIGLFTTELEAHLAWKRRKHELACQLADSEYCTDPRLAEALRTRYL